MKSVQKIRLVAGFAAVLALGACESMNSNTAGSGGDYRPSVSANGSRLDYGVVQSIDVIKQDNAGIGGSGIGIGTIAGAVVGGIIGNQVGAGRGNTAATVIGAAGGAYAGHELEKRNQQQADAYKFNIRMDNGSYQTLTQSTYADIRVGDRVQIDNGIVRRY
jgi:outer membrane lipoprotein SlyB